MGSPQDFQLRQTKNIWLLLSTLIISLFLFFTAAAYHVSNLHQVQKHHASAALSEITALIESHKSHLSTRDIKTAELEARSIGSFFSGLASSLGSGVESAAESAASDLGLGNITSLISGLSGLLSGNGSILDNIAGELATPAKFLGMGLAVGGLTGLNMTTSMNTSASGFDAVAMNLGSGLTSTIFSSPNVSSAISGSSITKSAVESSSSTESDGGFLGGATGTLGQAVLALSQGLGSGAVQGLKLNTLSTGSSFNTSGVNGIAGNFGQGLSSSTLGGLNITLPSLSLSSLMSSLTKRDTDIEATTGQLDFLALIRREFDTLDSKNKRSLSAGLVSTISNLALGAGTGLGQGTAAGLGFQNISALGSTTSGIAGITQNFVSGLSSSFLTNGTFTNIIKSVSSKSSNSTTATNSSSTSELLSSLSGLGGNVDIAKIAEGLAVGLVSGAGSQVSSLQLIAANTTSFNDSVDGAATGFGRGLGSEGAKLVSSLISNGLPSTLAKRNAEAEAAIVHLAGENVGGSARLRGRGNSVMAIARRASTPTTAAITTNATDIAAVITSLNASSINPLLQTGVDALTCTGVGGLIGVFLGLVDSKTIDTSSISSSKSNITLPNQLFITRNAGNTYAINPSKGISGASINGLTATQLVLLAGLHIVMAIQAWFVAIPLLLLFSSTQKLALFFQPNSKTSTTGLPQFLKTQKYLFWGSVLFSFVGFVFGVVMVGSGKHMRGAHQILGLILFLLTLISGAVHLKLNPFLLSFSKNSNATVTPKPPPSKNLLWGYRGLIGVVVILAMATLLTGFGDLMSLSMCIVQEVISVPGFVAVGMVLIMPWLFALAIYGLKSWVTSRFQTTSSSISSQKTAISQPKQIGYPGHGLLGSGERNGDENSLKVERSYME